MQAMNRKRDQRGREVVLDNLVKEHGWTIGAELGVWKGRVYTYLIKNNPNLTLIGVDIYESQPDNQTLLSQETYTDKGMWDHEKYYQGLLRFQSKYPERAKFIRDYTNNAVNQIEDKSLDFIFIDADHSEKGVRDDITNWLPKIKDEGWITGHDIDWKTVKKVVDELLPNYEVYSDNVWARPKIL